MDHQHNLQSIDQLRPAAKPPLGVNGSSDRVHTPLPLWHATADPLLSQAPPTTLLHSGRLPVGAPGPRPTRRPPPAAERSSLSLSKGASMEVFCPACDRPRAYLWVRDQVTRSGATWEVYACETCGRDARFCTM
jgi:hypothetical protein